MALLFPTWKNSTLKDITKPYLGEYECKSAVLGKKDLLKNFSNIILTLREDNTFLLRYQEKKGKPREETGRYHYDAEKKCVRFFFDGKRGFERDFPLENGDLNVALKMGAWTLSLRFEQK